MSEFGRRLVRAAREVRSIARGEAAPSKTEYAFSHDETVRIESLSREMGISVSELVDGLQGLDRFSELMGEVLARIKSEGEPIDPRYLERFKEILAAQK